MCLFLIGVVGRQPSWSCGVEIVCHHIDGGWEHTLNVPVLPVLGGSRTHCWAWGGGAGEQAAELMMAQDWSWPTEGPQWKTSSGLKEVKRKACAWWWYINNNRFSRECKSISWTNDFYKTTAELVAHCPTGILEALDICTAGQGRRLQVSPMLVVNVITGRQRQRAKSLAYTYWIFQPQPHGMDLCRT